MPYTDWALASFEPCRIWHSATGGWATVARSSLPAWQAAGWAEAGTPGVPSDSLLVPPVNRVPPWPPYPGYAP